MDVIQGGFNTHSSCDRSKLDAKITLKPKKWAHNISDFLTRQKLNKTENAIFTPTLPGRHNRLKWKQGDKTMKCREMLSALLNLMLSYAKGNTEQC